MPECHKCRWNGKRSKRCLTCRGAGDTNHKGQSFVSIDAGDDSQTLGEVEASLMRVRPAMDADAVPDVARRIMAAFMDLTPQEFALVQGLMRQRSLADIARDTGETRAAACARLGGIVERHPLFAFLRRNGRFVRGKEAGAGLTGRPSA